MAFLKFFELNIVLCHCLWVLQQQRISRVWEHEQQWLSEYFQNACRQILLIKRNRKLSGSRLPREFQCVGGRGFSAACPSVVLFAGLLRAWPQLLRFPRADSQPRHGLGSGPGSRPAFPLVRAARRERGAVSRVGAVSRGGLCPTRVLYPTRVLCPTTFPPAFPESPTLWDGDFQPWRRFLKAPRERETLCLSSC